MADLGTDAPLDAGAGAFPPGPMPNYDNPETLAPATVAVALTFTILATLTTALRVWGTSQNSMIQRRLKIGWEEFLIIIALVQFLHLGLTQLLLTLREGSLVVLNSYHDYQHKIRLWSSPN